MIAGLAGFIHAVLHLSQKKKDALRAFVDLRSQVPLVVSWWHPAEHVKILIIVLGPGIALIRGIPAYVLLFLSEVCLRGAGGELPSA